MGPPSATEDDNYTNQWEKYKKSQEQYIPVRRFYWVAQLMPDD